MFILRRGGSGDEYDDDEEGDRVDCGLRGEQGKWKVEEREVG